MLHLPTSQVTTLQLSSDDKSSPANEAVVDCTDVAVIVEGLNVHDFRQTFQWQPFKGGQFSDSLRDARALV